MKLYINRIIHTNNAHFRIVSNENILLKWEEEKGKIFWIPIHYITLFDFRRIRSSSSPKTESINLVLSDKGKITKKIIHTVRWWSFIIWIYEVWRESNQCVSTWCTLHWSMYRLKKKELEYYAVLIVQPINFEKTEAI